MSSLPSNRPIDGPSKEEEHFELLQDLEKQTSEKIRGRRAYERLAIKAKVILQSGNSSELLDYKVQGVTGDISCGGCRVMLPIPAHVGDIYRLQIERGELDLPLIFARCIKCLLVREDAYEACFSFFTKINLSENVAVQQECCDLI